MVEYLLQRRANVNALDEYNNSALNIACNPSARLDLYGLEFVSSIVQCLLDNGANITHPDSENKLPLYQSIKWGLFDLTKLLVETFINQGGNINNLKVDQEKTALQFAKKCTADNIIEYLVSKGAV
eukprot:TRINITY_DN6254_c0_g2_i1.p1 TRINITY_DN6254_c0_g2~~TRINITY_DN6254_c0_g2_i1.p1  ORF type:complete len:126 (+),score=29.40 TRINITY_DN6254_c0_g2_i1:275-652(+)